MENSTLIHPSWISTLIPIIVSILAYMHILELNIFSALSLCLFAPSVLADYSDSISDNVEGLRSLIFAPDAGKMVVALESTQSSVCSPTDERLQNQCFSELPADRYEVLEGSPVRMRCRVSRQKGKAQWRAHNTLLGMCFYVLCLGILS